MFDAALEADFAWTGAQRYCKSGISGMTKKKQPKEKPKESFEAFFRNNLARLKITSEAKNNLKWFFFTYFKGYLSSTF